MDENGSEFLDLLPFGGVCGWLASVLAFFPARREATVVFSSHLRRPSRLS